MLKHTSSELEGFLRKPRSVKSAARRGVAESALITCALIAANEALARYGILKIPNPPALALIAVIYAGYSAGLRAGLLSAALAVLYGLYFFSPPGAALQFQGDDAARMAVLALVAPFLAWMTGALKNRTERAVRSARDSETRYRTLSDLSSDWYWEQDENFRFMDMSGDVVRAAGSSVGSHIGKTRRELPTLGVSEEDWARQRAVLEAHQPYRDFEFQRVNEAGETIWMSTSGVPVFDDAGRFKGYRGVARDITERKTADEAIRESEARFRGAFQLGLVGMALTSPTKGLIEVNGPLCRMLGYSREQLVGTTWVQHTHPDDVAANLALLERALAGETDAYGMQKRFLRADGDIVHAQIAASCVRNPDGSARYFVLMVEDISERKRAEQALASAKERLQRALEGSRLALWDADLRSGEVYQSEGWAELLGGPVVETRTTIDELTKLVHAEDLGHVVRASGETVKGIRAEYSVEHRVRARTGEWKWILSTGTVSERDAAGRALRMTGTNRDITARKRAEQELRASEERYRTLVEGSIQGVYIHTGGIIQFANAAAARIFGYASPAELVGQHYSVLVPSHERARLEANRLARLRGEPVPERVESQRLRKDASLIWTEVFASVVSWRSEPAVLVAHVDITQRKEAEDNFRRALAELRETHARLQSVNEELRREVAERQRAEEEVRQLSLTDELTGLHNRRGFFLLAEQEYQLARRTNISCTVLFVDLDGLKQVNDDLGHDEGDAMIVAAARLLKMTFRATDVVARLGGDEFAILTWDAGSNPDELITRVQGDVAKFNRSGDRRYQLSLSVGGVRCEPGVGVLLEHWLARADQAMYAAKSAKKVSAVVGPTKRRS